ncbi:MAG: hypothetical protein HPAVJP_2260 [Candidatus Hepatoplasma vulgare]|nr:MAG: hypothetical protein HPAVJP_2260 [Candidatus Hepatoplasma sp.]
MWFLERHNEETLYWLTHNNKKTKIVLKRNIKFTNHLDNLIYRKYFDSNQGYFKYKAKGFNSLFISFNVDLIFVNWDNIIINLYENFSTNKFSNFHSDAKFYYVLPVDTIKKNKLNIGDALNHQRLSKKESKKHNKIDQSFY